MNNQIGKIHGSKGFCRFLLNFYVSYFLGGDWMTTTEAEIIKILAEEKNMRKAAERLFLTQPALSQRLQSIEKYWGAQLFIRSQKGLRLHLQENLVIQYAIETIAKKRRSF